MNNSLLNEAGFNKTVFYNFAKENSIFSRAARILELVSDNGLGIGEVLQDFSTQTSRQLYCVISAAKHLNEDSQSEEDIEILKNSRQIVKNAKRVLELTPIAMLRNNTKSVGKKEKLCGKDIDQFAKVFAASPEVVLLTTYESEDFIY